MTRFIIAALVAVFLFVEGWSGLLVSKAVAETKCATVDIIKSDVAGMNIPGATVTPMTPAQSKAFLAAFNALPPVSALAGDFLVIVNIPNSPKIAIVVMVGKCALGTAYAKRSTYESIMGSGA